MFHAILSKYKHYRDFRCFKLKEPFLPPIKTDDELIMYMITHNYFEIRMNEYLFIVI